MKPAQAESEIASPKTARNDSWLVVIARLLSRSNLNISRCSTSATEIASPKTARNDSGQGVIARLLS